MSIDEQYDDANSNTLLPSSSEPPVYVSSSPLRHVSQEKSTGPADILQTAGGNARHPAATPPRNAGPSPASMQRSSLKVHGDRIRTGGDFGATIRRNGIVVDKSLICRVFWEDRAKAVCVHLPRRFGKTFNLSIIEEFFNVVTMRDMPRGSASFDKELGKAARRELFDQSLLETEAPRFFDRHFCRYPVIRLCFKGVTGSSQQTYYRSLMFRAFETVDTWVERLYDVEIKPAASESWKDLRDYHTSLKRELESIPASKWERDMSVVRFLIEYLMEFLRRQFDQKIMVLIDEYDVPLTVSRGKDWAGDTRAGYAKLLSFIFKNNEHLEKGLLVGVLRFTLSSVESGANSFGYHDLMADTDFAQPEIDMDEEAFDAPTPQLADFFGYSESEVRLLFDVLKRRVGQRSTYPPVESVMTTMHQWYDGYRIGQQTGRYNPYACCIFLADLIATGSLVVAARSHWENTGSFQRLAALVSRSRDKIQYLGSRLIREYDQGVPSGLAIATGSSDSRLEDDADGDDGRLRFMPNSLPSSPSGEYSLNELVTFFMYTGYLTLGSEGQIRIPNGEVRKVWRELLR
ncbi:hypothetical protein GGF46_002210 [Coemansia sp. RSA 552]|nr:hypothetical protein GGF46_002210 [Coemansia sp. RSA 552]